MADSAPFHYSGLIVELSEALKHVLQAQDWLERPPHDTADDDARRSERGNLDVALTHLRNAFQGIDARHADLHFRLRMLESVRRDHIPADILDAEAARHHAPGVADVERLHDDVTRLRRSSESTD